jgi:hypothetical protein
LLVAVVLERVATAPGAGHNNVDRITSKVVGER